VDVHEVPPTGLHTCGRTDDVACAQTGWAPGGTPPGPGIQRWMNLDRRQSSSDRLDLGGMERRRDERQIVDADRMVPGGRIGVWQRVVGLLSLEQRSRGLTGLGDASDLALDRQPRSGAAKRDIVAEFDAALRDQTDAELQALRPASQQRGSTAVVVGDPGK